MFTSLAGIQVPKVPWVLWIVLETPSVTALSQAKEEFGSGSELGVLCKLLAAHSREVTLDVGLKTAWRE